MVLTFEYSGTNGNFIVASTTEPYTVFGAPYSPGCASLAITVNSGTLQSSFATLDYDSTAGVHGLALSPKDDFIYSADDMGNAVWVHSYNKSSGAVEEVQYITAPTGANPRHLAVHPNGGFVFVVYEELNEVAVYGRDVANGKLTSMNTTYSLLPSGMQEIGQISCTTQADLVSRVHQHLLILG